MLNFSPWNLLFIVINLLVLLVLMKKFLYQPVLGVIQKRQELLNQQFAQAQNSQKEADALKKQYEASLADAKEESDRMIKEAKMQAGIEYDLILATADEKSRQILDDAKKAGQWERERAVKEAGDQIAQLAIAAASKIVSQTCGEKQNYDIYEEFLKKAGEKSEADEQ
ncbi:MAG: F0F1 ATP synthase subunit B [Ruminococcus sp.]|nr:F0F1 ATP synthase subunit B [Ruminococcus sp.]